MDLRESIRGVYSPRSLCTTCYETFLPQNFHGIWYLTQDDNSIDLHTTNNSVTNAHCCHLAFSNAQTKINNHKQYPWDVIVNTN